IGLIDLVTMKAIVYTDETLGADYVVSDILPEYSDEAHHYREKLIEKVSEADDKLLEKYLSGQEISEDEIKAALRQRVITAGSGKKNEPVFVPVICGAAFKNKGVQPLLDSVVDYLPSPLDIPAMIGLDPTKAEKTLIERTASDDAPFAPHAFKIMIY